MEARYHSDPAATRNLCERISCQKFQIIAESIPEEIGTFLLC